MSMNTNIHSSDVMHAADFSDADQGDTARSYSRSLSPTDFVSQPPLKRQRTEGMPNLNETNGLKQARHHTFSLWTCSASFHSRMIEAGFFGCNVEDRVICIYCNLICQNWNIEIDDPCEVHTVLSPSCLFVKSMLVYNSLPSHTDYVNPERRLASFADRSKNSSPLMDDLVNAGFFFDGSKIKCFYCNGLFKKCDSNNHPIAEHVRWFPYCNYARQLCGEELYHKIQQSIKSIQRNSNRHRLDTPDRDTILKFVADRLDLPFSKYLIEVNKFKRSIIERCFEDQFRLKHDDFVNDVDLFIACLILQKQNEFIDKKKKNVVIPSLAMQEICKEKQICLNSRHPPLHYTDILKSFEHDLQEYRNSRQTLGEQFTEEKTITIEREQSLHKWSCTKPSRRDITIGGWIIHDEYSECPHCHVRYYNWKADDNPWLIHRYLSPLCLFVLSKDPLNSNSIPIRKVEEQFTDDDIENAQSQPYTGLVQTRHGSFSQICDRQNSFKLFPGGCSIDTNELAMSGFYYRNRDRSIRCFYCRRGMPALGPSLRSNQLFRHLHLRSQCRYIQQMNDCDPQPSIQQAPGKCAWCMVEEKRILALPCRHFCLCGLCGRIKRLCPTCQKEVTAYAIVYSS